MTILEKRIARVFPRRTTATPDDLLAYTRPPPNCLPDIDAVHVSVTFTCDIPKAERLAERWRHVGVPVAVGGPAYDDPGADFVPGMYLKQGYVMTSRGCPNKCAKCFVPWREGPLRELPIADGWDVLDNNLLACSEQHIRSVFDMLAKQPEKPKFTGGLEAARLRPWHVDLLRESNAERIYFAYDMPKKYDALIEAGRLLREGGITQGSHRAMSYVLIGFEGDTYERAEFRLKEAARAGFMPFAMLYMAEDGTRNEDWRPFQREWASPRIVGTKVNRIYKERVMS